LPGLQTSRKLAVKCEQVYRSQPVQSLSVSQLNQAIAAVLSNSIGSVRVVGEVSNFKLARSGHRYFTLKDDTAQISCVMWRGRSLSFLPSDGMQVVVTGELTVYAPRGQYQIDCRSLTPLGRGELYLAFEALKEQLTASGYFAQERKRPLPSLPLHIGVVTSATGAAIRDILTTLDRRLPACRVTVAPVAVQGDRAPAEIATAIARLNRETDCQVLIVGRGGGSLEDLWAFNTPVVAEAIYQSRIPIVSAVGHETDATIADFVADARAATPTAAATLVTPQTRADLLQHLQRQHQQLDGAVQFALQWAAERSQALSRSYAFRSIPQRFQLAAQQVDAVEARLQQLTQQALHFKQLQLAASHRHLQALHPLAPLERGFALLRGQKGWLGVEDSLRNYSTVTVVRSREMARVAVEVVKPNPLQTVANDPSSQPQKGKENLENLAQFVGAASRLSRHP
jgi:exodeoxyribonuclease VII large subunit